MTRIAALVVAVGLVVGALVIRSRLDENERRGPYRLVCATEFAEICRTLTSGDLSVSIEPAGVTTDRLIALPRTGDPGFDGWLSAGRWAAMVTDARRAAGLDQLTGNAAILAHTRVAIAVWRDRGAVLRKACAAALSWRCLGDRARVNWKANGGEPAWGPVKVALPDPTTESAGLAALAAATAGFTDSTNFVPDALVQDDAYQAWLSGVRLAIPLPPPDFARMMAAGASVADIYLGLEAEIDAVLATAANKGAVEAVNLSPVLDVEAVLAGRAKDPRGTPDGLAAALRQAGWVDAPKGAAPLPSAAALAGLRRLWKEAT